MNQMKPKGNTVTDVANLFENQGGPSAKSLLVDVGDEFVGIVQGPAVKLQTKNYDDDQPAYWDDEKQNPKMAWAINLMVNGELRTLWAPIPSDVCVKFLAAVKATKSTNVAEGGKLRVKLVDTEAVKLKNGKKGNPKKIHEVEYTPPALDEDVPFDV
jgi:hypothetical protein